MRALAFSLVLLPIFAVGFDLQLLLGYTYGEMDGWTLGTGFYEEPFGSDIVMVFKSSSPTNFYSFTVAAFIPVFEAGNYSLGPSVAYVHGNYSGEWEDGSWIGGVLEKWTGEYHARIALFYPVQGSFDFSRDTLFEFRYFLKPPNGMKFKDRLYFEIFYFRRIFRFAVGLLEPIP